MTKAQVRKLVVWLIVAVAYIHLSGFMAHYYTETNLKKSPTTINKILIQPMGTAVNVLSLITENQKQPETNMDKLIEKSTFYIYFFSWPFLVLCALIYWIAVFIILVIMMLSFLLSMLLSLILWGLTYLLLGFKIF